MVMNGNVQQKNLLKEFLTNRTLAGVLEIILLMLAGALAIVLHARLRTPINIPGHHGIEFMAIIVAARLSSGMKWASSISAFGIGVFILFPVLGFNYPMMGFNYMLPCFFVDIAYNYFKNVKYRNLILSLAAGIGYMLIPISRIITSVSTGFPYSTFLKHGFATPVVTFLLFGFLGGLLGTGIYLLGRNLLKKI